MYVVYETLQVAGGRQQQAEQRLASGHVLMQPLPGFQEADILKYLGNNTTYLAVRGWHDRHDFEGWEASEARAQYLAARPEGLYSVPPRIEFFETVSYQRVQDSPSHALHMAVQVAGGQQARYEERERALSELLAQAPGFCSVRTLRFRGNPNRYLRIALWTDRDALRTFTSGPVLPAFRQAHPEEGLFLEPNMITYYEVLHALSSEKQGAR